MYLGKIHQVVKTPLWWILYIDSWTVCHQKIFLYTCSGACSKYTKKSTHWGIHHRKVENHQCIHYWGVETPWCIHHRGVILATGESFNNIKEHRQSLKHTKRSTPWCIHHWCRDSLVYSWSGNHLGRRGVVFTNFKELQQSLKGPSF
jgi:hypothetical protein